MQGLWATTATNALEHEVVITKVQGRLRLAPPALLNSTDQKDSPIVKVRYLNGYLAISSEYYCTALDIPISRQIPISQATGAGDA